MSASKGQKALHQHLVEQLLKRAQRKIVTKPSAWAEQYRVMTKTYPGPWRFTHHPWARQIHDDLSEAIACQKAAQMAVSECAINRAFYALDIKGEDVLYLLPSSKPDASDFSTGRFEPALQASEHIANMFSDTKNIGLKKAGTAILYIRGSKSESQLKSIPTGNIIYDEFDEMWDGVRALAQERMSGQSSRSEFLLSTPTIPDFGINAEYLASDQKRFFFRCPRCGQLEELVEDSLVITADRWNAPEIKGSHLICTKTKLVLPHEDKTTWLADGVWIPQVDGSSVSGYHISQLYSMAKDIPALYASAKLRGELHPAYAQEFAKSKQGMPYIEKGARVTDEELEYASRMNYNMTSSWQGGFVVMGVDVGTRLHFEVVEVTFLQGTGMSDINMMTTTKVLKAGSVIDFSELGQLMQAFHVVYCVIDANPERRKAQEFAENFPGRVSICIYIEGLSNSNPINILPELNTVKVDRTSWLDLSLSRFRNGTKIIPRDVGEEYKGHMKALVRRYVFSKNGDISSRYVNSNAADHLAHAANYAEIAIKVACSVGTVQHI